jgi:hypothetical protein
MRRRQKDNFLFLLCQQAKHRGKQTHLANTQSPYQQFGKAASWPALAWQLLVKFGMPCGKACPLPGR